MSRYVPPRRAILTILAIAGATIAGALASQHLFGLVPCKLCLWERYPYYVALPAAALLASGPARFLRPGLLLLALVFAISALLGGYHAGVEWGWFTGPADCGGGAPTAAGVEDFMKSLGTTRAVSCDEAAWRLTGLSLAGWNALISAGLFVLSAWSAAAGPRTR